MPGAAFSAAARRALAGYAWPGNVRELAHVVERAVLLAAGSQIDVADLNLTPLTASPADGDLAVLDQFTLEEIERLMLQRALAATADNVSEAARKLGLTRMAMRYRMQKHGIRTNAIPSRILTGLSAA